MFLLLDLPKTQSHQYRKNNNDNKFLDRQESTHIKKFMEVLEMEEEDKRVLNTIVYSVNRRCLLSIILYDQFIVFVSLDFVNHRTVK